MTAPKELEEYKTVICAVAELISDLGQEYQTDLLISGLNDKLLKYVYKNHNQDLHALQPLAVGFTDNLFSAIREVRHNQDKEQDLVVQFLMEGNSLQDACEQLSELLRKYCPSEYAEIAESAYDWNVEMAQVAEDTGTTS